MQGKVDLDDGAPLARKNDLLVAIFEYIKALFGRRGELSFFLGCKGGDQGL